MKLLAEENRILISLGEFVSIARRRISPTLPIDEDEPTGQKPSRAALSFLGVDKGVRLEREFTADGYDYRLFGYTEIAENGEFTLVKSSTGATQSAKKAEVAQARGEAFVLALMLMERDNIDSVTARIIYVNETTGTSEERVAFYYGAVALSYEIVLTVSHVTVGKAHRLHRRYAYSHALDLGRGID